MRNIGEGNYSYDFSTGLIALLALSVLTPYLYYIPKTCLAAVIISAVIFMVEINLVILVWKSRKLDLVPFFFTFILGALINLQVGILVGVAINLGTLLYFTGKPKVQINQVKVSIIIRYLFVSSLSF